VRKKQLKGAIIGIVRCGCISKLNFFLCTLIKSVCFKPLVGARNWNNPTRTLKPLTGNIDERMNK